MSDSVLWILALACALAGLFLVARGLFHDRSRGRRRCPKCWYDMSGVESPRCPECGKAIKRERMLYRTRRRWRFVAMGLALLLAFEVLHLVPQARREGVWAVLPNTALILALDRVGGIDPWDELRMRLRRHEGNTGSAHGLLDRWQWTLVRGRCVDRIEETPLAATAQAAAGVLMWMPHDRLSPAPEMIVPLVDAIDQQPVVYDGAIRAVLFNAPLNTQERGALLMALIASSEKLGSTNGMLNLIRYAAPLEPATARLIERRLIASINDGRPYVRQEATRAASSLQMPSTDVLRAIQMRRTDADADVREAAEDTIGAWEQRGIRVPTGG